jgi:hypothetical protein
MPGIALKRMVQAWDGIMASTVNGRQALFLFRWSWYRLGNRWQNSTHHENHRDGAWDRSTRINTARSAVLETSSQPQAAPTSTHSLHNQHSFAFLHHQQSLLQNTRHSKQSLPQVTLYSKQIQSKWFPSLSSLSLSLPPLAPPLKSPCPRTAPPLLPPGLPLFPRRPGSPLHLPPRPLLPLLLTQVAMSTAMPSSPRAHRSLAPFPRLPSRKSIQTPKICELF